MMKNTGRWVLMLELAFSLSCGIPEHPQEDHAFIAGQRVVLESRILAEERELLVFLPESYGAGDLRYPVLYLLDAESEFLGTIGIVEFLSGIDRIPELVVVGIVNTNRSRDLTPESTDSEETEFWNEVGGADRFLQALREELIPYVDRSYRTEPFRIIRGGSFGGLLAIHDYMSAAPVFDAVIASSPAVGWNYGKLLNEAPEFFAAGAPRLLYVASAERDFPGNLEDILEFERIVGASSDEEVWTHDHFENEGHYSLSLKSTYQGLEAVFAAWPVPDEVAETADFDLYRQHFEALSSRYGYTIPIPMRSLVRMGNQLLREQDFETGISVFERALEVYPGFPEAHWRVGEAYRLAEELEEARGHFQRAYDLAAEQNAPDLADYKETLETFEEGPH
ncbi:MAG: tetratricopeptide repeat protein [Gemmatimonadetes bacterium]|nr:tetratricopeptide repeat protein [Gemmatimonadota bacterium]